ncbi:hypothetical protein [Xenorhabdus ehlersii]|uniref:Transposase n=1 Tax=Xenorhabdus ehlersii TaxID=290111 RepID=A0A2D0ITX2_9GAMM|nr:hypothetical protein [Xenorhabdus ehlersii]PHM25315.1 transposase [Xenorhabdus ehlersii]PHM26892.1 transposase [Xenorhabdus ehlersii]
MIDRYFKENDACQRLATIPGIEPVIATTIVSRVGDPGLLFFMGIPKQDGVMRHAL